MPLTVRKLIAFWAPLEATWLMMALEGPLLAAIIARLDAPKLNLAAYGVALAIAMLVEAPIIMVMSAATALAADRESYRKLRNFTFALNAAITLIMLVAIVPAVFDRASGMLGLPPEVASRTWRAIALFLPWPAAIGYRRLFQGIMIRSGATRRVAYGTGIRLTTMAAVGLSLAWWGRLDGASVGAAALSSGVVAEAIGSRFMAHAHVTALWANPGRPGVHQPGYREIFAFYYPLALTSFLNMGIQPIVTFFMGTSRMPIESLAALPVVNSLVFLFRTLGLAGQETTIAALAKGRKNLPALRRFAGGLAVVASGGLALIACTPLGEVWFLGVSGLPPALADLATLPSCILVVMPAMTVWMCWQRALLVSHRTTRSVTLATAIEVAGVVVVMFVGNALGWIGLVSASLALVVGRLAGNLVLVRPVRRALASGAVAYDADPAATPIQDDRSGG
jgi:progressive ankylosis protein